MKDKFDFISSIVSSLAWPIAAITIAIIFRHPLQDLLKRIGKLKYKDIEADFSKEIKDVKEEAKTANILGVFTPSKNNKTTKSLTEEVEEIAHISPEAAITLAWIKVESAIMNVIVNKNISPDYPYYNSVLKNINIIKNYYDIDEKTIDVIESLRRLRNEVLHTHPLKNIIVTYKDALDYGKMAEALIDKIDTLH